MEGVLTQTQITVRGSSPTTSPHPRHLNLSYLMARIPEKWKLQGERNYKRGGGNVQKSGKGESPTDHWWCVPMGLSKSGNWVPLPYLVPRNQLTSLAMPLSTPHHTLNAVQHGLPHCVRRITSLYEIDYITWTWVNWLYNLLCFGVLIWEVVGHVLPHHPLAVVWTLQWEW